MMKLKTLTRYSKTEMVEMQQVAKDNRIKPRLYVQWADANNALLHLIQKDWDKKLMNKENALFHKEFKIHIQIINNDYLELNLTKKETTLAEIRIDQVTHEYMKVLAMTLALIIDYYKDREASS